MPHSRLKIDVDEMPQARLKTDVGLLVKEQYDVPRYDVSCHVEE